MKMRLMPTQKQFLIQEEAFFSITGHSADGIENNGITRHNNLQELVKFFSALDFCAGIYFCDNLGIWIR